MREDQRRVRVRLDVVHIRRLVPESGLRGERWLDPRHPAVAIDRVDEPGLVAADVAAGALEDDDVEVPAETKDVGAEQALLARLLDGDAHPLNGQGVFVADIDVGLARAGGTGSDQQPFDDEVRVALHDGAVHPGAGVTFIRVADEVLRRGRRRAQEVPLAADREVRAAASAHARVEHLFDDRFVSEVERLAQAVVPAKGDVVVDVFRVDGAHLRHQAASLAAHERMVSEEGNLRRRVAFDDAERQLRQVPAFDHAGFEQLIDPVGRDVRVQHRARTGCGTDGDTRLHPVEPPRAGAVDDRIQPSGFDCRAEGVEGLLRAACQRRRVERDVEVDPTVVLGGVPGVLGVGDNGDELNVHAPAFTLRAS